MRINVVIDGNFPNVGEMADEIQSRVPEAAGLSTANTVRVHLEKKNLQPNKRNWPKTGLYGKAANSVRHFVDGDKAEVHIGGSGGGPDATGIGQRYRGGTIRAKDKLLTIPARQEAYGKRAREFDNLTVAVWRNSSGGFTKALVEAEATTLKRSRRKGKTQFKDSGRVGGLVVYWLVESVTQDPDPTVLPSESELSENLRTDIQEMISGVIDTRAGGSS